jgi:hypothetical protein
MKEKYTLKITTVTKKHFEFKDNMDLASSYYAESYVLTPCKINIVESRRFKDGTSDYLIFGSFINATSKERPSLGKVRAKSMEEAIKKAQEILNDNFKDFAKIVDNR